MRIVMVSGIPSVSCGVADYTGRLILALEKIGIKVHLLTQNHWSLFDIRQLIREIRRLQPDVIHIQYPAAAYGKSLAPQMLTLWAATHCPVVITIHEFSQVHLLRRIAILPFSFARYLIFTNPFELTSLAKWVFWARKKSSVLPLGSSIPFEARALDANSMQGVYFGLIRENKGLEEFLALAQLCLQTSQPYQFLVLGSVQAGSEEYYEQLRKKFVGLSNLDWELDLPAKTIARYLSSSGFAYLPFPDGASERRTSLLAALGNCLPVLTTKGLHTPSTLNEVVEFVSSPEDALKMLNKWRGNPSRREKLQSRATEYIQRFNWDYIARSHLEIYEQWYKR
jgi:glycosyltransferase involved in cell wall biosynthesis